jgi:hypothetical protein
MINNRDWSIKYSDAKQQPNGSYIFNDGTIYWFNDKGQAHKEDGPASIYLDGSVYWYLNDKNYVFNQWCTQLNIPDEQKLLLRLQYD